MKTSGLKTYFLITLITIALCGASCLLGGLTGTFAWIVIAALLGVVMYRYHFMFGIVNSGFILVIFSLFSNLITGLTNAAPLILLGATMALGTRFKISLSRLLTIASALFLLNTLFGMELLKIASGGNMTLNSLWLDAGQQFRETTMQLYPESAAMFEDAIAMTVNFMLTISPALMVIASVFMAYVLILIYKKVQTIQGLDMSFLCSFSKLQAEKGFSIFFLILLLLFTVVPKGIFCDAILNVVIILTAIFFVLGFSVLCFKLKKDNSNVSARRLFIIVLIVSSTAFFMVPLLALAVCGLLDSFFDYRKIRPQNGEEN